MFEEASDEETVTVTCDRSRLGQVYVVAVFGVEEACDDDDAVSCTGDEAEALLENEP